LCKLHIKHVHRHSAQHACTVYYISAISCRTHESLHIMFFFQSSILYTLQQTRMDKNSDISIVMKMS